MQKLLITCCAVIAFIGSIGLPAVAGPAPMVVLITIDTETSSGCGPTGCFPEPMSERIFGIRDGKAYGIPLMMDMLEKHGMRATFFVNAYLDSYYPEQDVAAMVASIKKRGHDVQFHAHEEFRCFRTCGERDQQCRHQCITKESYLGGNTLENQLQILREGMDNLERWTGEHPIAFRGGGYDADATTLKALNALGISIDSSLSDPEHNLARVLPANKLGTYEGVLEIPLLAYRENLIVSKRYRHLDIESSTLLEQEHLLNESARMGARVAVLMMHSFSFCRPETGCPATRNIERFDKLLTFIQQSPGLRAMTMRDFWDAYQKNPAAYAGSGAIPEIGYWLTLYRSIERFDEGGKNMLFLLANAAALLMLIIAAFILVRLRRRRTVAD